MAYLNLLGITAVYLWAAVQTEARPIQRQTGSPPAITRAPNSTLALPSSPPQFGYSLANAFPGLSFNSPVCIVSPPGETNRLFILEKGNSQNIGNIVVITNLANPTRTVFMSVTVMPDGESGLLGMAFHPGYATNGYFYVFYSANFTTTQGTGRHQCLSRFEVSPTNPNQGVPGSELRLINQYDTASNHNGSDLHFGPDGYLYVSVGDEGPQNDGARNSQRIDKNFFSAIMRIDVDKRPGNLPPNQHPANTTNYFVPADNPFVGATSFNGAAVNPSNVRTEFYAVGFRNPWRMSFDSLTGQLYVGDVGQDAWEEVDIVVKGGNYGWVFREGTHNNSNTGGRTPPAGFAPIPPIHDYPHGSGSTSGNSVSGGIVYRGQRLSQIYGAYVFGDYTSGNIWILHPDGTNYVPSQRLVGGSSPVAFGTDPRNGDVLVAQLGGQIGRLNYNTNSVGPPLPPTLADTGAFSDLSSLTVNSGIVPYDLNLPFWSDGARKQRWFSIPNTNLTIGFNRESNWSFPTGAVWIKHFELELTNGAPESRRRLETRFIVRNTNGVYGVTYRWDDAQTNAALVSEAGLDESFVIHDGSTTRTQVWHYPSRNECVSCHTAAGGGTLGFTTAQMNRDFDYGSAVDNQIQALSDAGYFANNVSNLHILRSHVALTNQSASLESRVRSYLAANCANCHQPGGQTPALFDARFLTLTANAGLIDGKLNNVGNSSDNRVIKPGSPELSVMLQRISKRGVGQMPPISTTVVDTNAVQLFTEWINSEASTFQSFTNWQAANFADPEFPAAAPTADPDNDGSSNYLEFLIGTDPNTATPPWGISAQAGTSGIEIHYPQIARRGFEVQWTTNIFDPASWQPLNVPGNAPFYSAANLDAVVEDLTGAEGPKFYRVRVFEQ